MDMLARRGHSELELRQKLSRDYEPAEIDAAIQFAKESKWMTEPEELSERVSMELGRKKKGHRFINQFLKNNGLPPVSKDLDEEVRKAREIIDAKMARKLAKGIPFDYEEKMKLHRTLANRGFDDETIRQALKDLKTSSTIEQEDT